MASIKPDFSRILFTGVKKKKNSGLNAQNEEQELRLRVLPENNSENEPLTKTNEEVEDAEKPSTVKLFSFSKNSASKSKPKNEKLVQEQKYVSFFVLTVNL